MSQLTTLSGVVSGLRVDTNITVNTTYSPNSNTASSTTTKTTTFNFRIDNRPAYMTVAVNLTNGDVITAAGIQRGEFEVIVFNNHTTKTIYSLPTQNPLWGLIGVVFGWMFSDLPYFIGWGIFASGAYYFWKTSTKKNKVKAAMKLVEKATPPLKT